MFDRLVLNRDFQKVYRTGSCLRDYYFNLYYCHNNLEKNRLGVIASKKFGNAVKRNRAKRLLREAFRWLDKKCRPGLDLIISAKSAMLGRKLPEIMAALEKSLIKSRIHTGE